MKNRNETGFDRNETGFDRNETGFDRNETGFDRNETGFDRNENGFDRNESIKELILSTVKVFSNPTCHLDLPLTKKPTSNILNTYSKNNEKQIKQYILLCQEGINIV